MWERYSIDIGAFGGATLSETEALVGVKPGILCYSETTNY